MAQHHAEGEDVRALIRRLATGLLRSHVGDGADEFSIEQAGGARLVVRPSFVQASQAEIEDLGAAVVAEKDIARLQIAMDHAGPVSRIQGFANLQGELEGFADGKSAGRNGIVQSLAGEILHHQARLAATLHHVVDGDDTGMVERRGEPGFAKERGRHGRIVHFGAHHFDGDLAAQAEITPAVDNAHATSSEPSRNLVVT